MLTTMLCAREKTDGFLSFETESCMLLQKSPALTENRSNDSIIPLSLAERQLRVLASLSRKTMANSRGFILTREIIDLARRTCKESFSFFSGMGSNCLVFR